MTHIARKLFAWFDRDRAVETLLGHKPHGHDEQHHVIHRWERARSAVLARPAFVGRPSSIAELPVEMTGVAAAFSQRADVKAVLSNLDWRVGIVDLNHVLASQPGVADERNALRLAQARQDDWASLANICLPAPRPSEQLDVVWGPGGKTLTVTSLNPNLRVTHTRMRHANPDIRLVEPGVYEANGSAAPERAAGSRCLEFIVGIPQSFVQVAQFEDRLLLRDGYHRCYGLLRKGITQIPCVIVKAITFRDTGAAQPGFIDAHILAGQQPPYLRDFLDDQVAASVEEEGYVKVVRIMAEEFFVKTRHADKRPA